ncbi:uncharacterized protein LOC135385235 isoform X4 [Ornithodoros turicata]|uniref:uncharacterized protein LOC135385235 isoform X4 n=1 Tax=Ornithodoros turicata TaxID=34597 RepID=UPI0031395905
MSHRLEQIEKYAINDKTRGKYVVINITACQVESSDSKDQRNSEQTQEELEEEMSHYWDYSIDLPAHFLVSFAVPPDDFRYGKTIISDDKALTKQGLQLLGGNKRKSRRVPGLASSVERWRKLILH